MSEPMNRFHHGETGAVGWLIVMWLAVVAVIGVTAIDAGSIAFTKFRLADVASTSSTQAANNFKTTKNVDAACQAAVVAIAAADASAKLANKGCVVDVPTGMVTITVRKEAKTIIVGRLSFAKHFAKVTATEANGPTSL